MSSRSFQLEIRSAASPKAVWRLVEDATTWSSFARFSHASYEKEGDPPPHGVGAIRRFGTGPIRSRERVVVYEPPHRLVYELVSGLPVRGYRAEVTVEPDGDGTILRWHSTWERTSPGLGLLMHRLLRKAVGDIARALAKAAQPP